MYYDHNIVTEEFNFYQLLPHKSQTLLIDTVFKKFVRKFDHFMKDWEKGFRNEFVIRLYARNYTYFDKFVIAGFDVTSIKLITEGEALVSSKEKWNFM